jgi:hypothetical protein
LGVAGEKNPGESSLRVSMTRPLGTKGGKARPEDGKLWTVEKQNLNGLQISAA